MSFAEGEWIWTELWAKDTEAAEAFYVDLAGYTVEQEEFLDDRSYTVFTSGGVHRAAVIENPFKELQRSHWLPYIRVRDPKALARSQLAGIKLLLLAILWAFRVS